MHVSPLEKKGIREEKRQRDKNCQVIHHAGQRTLCHLFFYFLSIFCYFWFDFPFRRHKKKKKRKEILDGGQTFSFLAIFIWFESSSYFLNGWTLRHIDSLCRLVNEKMSNSIGFSQLTCSQSETGFWFVSDFSFSFFLFYFCEMSIFFTIGRRHLYTDSQNSLWDVWLHQPKPL